MCCKHVVWLLGLTALPFRLQLQCYNSFTVYHRVKIEHYCTMHICGIEVYAISIIKKIYITSLYQVSCLSGHYML